MFSIFRQMKEAVEELTASVRALRQEVEHVAKLVVAMDNHRRWEQRLLELAREDQRLIKSLYYGPDGNAAQRKVGQEDEVRIQRGDVSARVPA